MSLTPSLCRYWAPSGWRLIQVNLSGRGINLELANCELILNSCRLNIITLVGGVQVLDKPLAGVEWVLAYRNRLTSSTFFPQVESWIT